MENINTKDYWESRFKSKNWGKSGNRQTKEYAIANVSKMSLSKNFNGSILDYGCALGDAIPIYHKAFPNAKLRGIDFSRIAIKTCENNYGNIAKFESGNYEIVKKQDIIIASHVMEHLTDDKIVVDELLSRCNELYIFVPYMENPLYIEHVNYYEEDYYDDFEVLEKKVFLVSYEYKMSVKDRIKSFLNGKYTSIGRFSKEIIMFRIKGSIL
ncbi:class I SAM-dependent methyltransferase [Winogradskyella sp. A2]|uniref:class I SAM-dependent methyltransferase n=1 Tax=Winogradskyella sp. A2 TaxID=3366944 RepID=UPI00398C2ADF